MAKDADAGSKLELGKRSAKRSAVGYFLALFVPLCLIVGGIMVVIYDAEVRTHVARKELQGKQEVTANRDAIALDLRRIISNILFLSRQSNLQNLLARERSNALEALERDYFVFCKSRGLYEQVRFLNSSGKEVVGVRFNGGRPAIVPRSRLQNQAESEEFKRSIALERGEVYVSRLEFRQESGSTLLTMLSLLSKRSDAKKRPKAVMHFGTPVYDSQGNKRGALLLDYRASAMLQKIKDQALLDRNGRWLHRGRMLGRWGFKDKGGRTFAKEYAPAWQHIREANSGQFWVEGAMFTFTTIYPLKEVRRVLSRDGPRAEGRTGNEKAYCWKLVSHVPPEALRVRLRRLRGGLVWFYAALVVLIGGAALPYACIMVRHTKRQEKFREYAIEDALTKVYNRRFGLEMLDRLVEECKLLDTKLCVFMVDVDNLKQVNDRFGHPAGDDLLRLVADALRADLRYADVVSRFGGDEFLVVLPSTALENGRPVIERVRKNIAARKPSKLAPYHVGFSFGGAEYDPKQNQLPSRLIDEADAQMYESKRKRKARVPD